MSSDISTAIASGATGTEERLSVPFAKQVPAADTETLSYTSNGPATVERISVRIYPGAETTLRIVPKIEPTGDGDAYPILPFEGKQYIDGDDDTFVFDVAAELVDGEKVVIEAENTDGNNAHNFRAVVDVDYRGGLESVIDGVVR